jgi:hypothetical protein
MTLAIFFGVSPMHICHSNAHFYGVVRKEGRWWFISPKGKPFFSMGVNCVNMGVTPEEYNPANPGYCALRIYPNKEAWQRTTLERLQQWGFNTIGGWSGDGIEQCGMPHTPVLHLGAMMGAPWCDMFSPKIEQTLDALAREYVLPHKDDPSLLGWFSDNELGWWDDSLFLHFLKQPHNNATRRQLFKLLREHYRGEFARFQRDFHTGKADSFDALEESSVLTLRPGGNGMEVINAFTYLLAKRYYRLVRDAIRRYDPHHLFLGDRYHNFYPHAVAKAASHYVDVISTNQDADWPDGGIARFFLEALHRLSGKPVLVTEFYFCAMENRSGNKNANSTFTTVQTQKERAAGFGANVTAFASLPYTVGAHWFQYYDEPPHGRPDGEDFNMGLVDIYDRPYEELTATASSLPVAEIHNRSISPQKSAVTEIPHAPASVETGLLAWDKARAFVASESEAPFADLYACWTPNGLYLAVHAIDYVDEQLYEGGLIPESERMHLLVNLGEGGKPVEVRFGPGGKAVIKDSRAPCWEWSRLNRYTVLLKLSPADVGKEKFAEGNVWRVEAKLASHSRAEQMKWNVTLRLGR